MGEEIGDEEFFAKRIAILVLRFFGIMYSCHPLATCDFCLTAFKAGGVK